MDWNNDGKKDIITGEYSGNIRIYLNINTDEDPVFGGFTYLQESGTNFDCGGYSHPHIVDWNNDNKKDVLCGESGGRIWLMINSGTDANPVFNGKEFLKDGTGLLDPGGVSAPTVCDLNRDGKKDLILGDTYGQLHYYENKGTDADPVFNGKTIILAGGSPFGTDYYSRPDVADWDDDGVMDIICGGYDGYIYYLHARGPLALSQNWIPEGTGGSINLDLDAGVSNAGRNYLVLGSITGTEPGTPLPGGQGVLPINWDVFTGLALSLVNTPVFTDFMGALSTAGTARAVLNIGPVPGAAGIIMSYAGALNNPWDYVTNGVNIEIIP